MLLYYVLVFVFLEFALQLLVYHSVSNVLAHLLFACISGGVLFLCSSLLPDKANRVISIALISVLVVYYEVQFIYYTIFKSFMPVSQIFLGAAAIFNFTAQILFAIKQNFIGFVLLLLPIPATLLLLTRLNFRIPICQPFCLLLLIIFRYCIIRRITRSCIRSNYTRNYNYQMLR